MRICKQFIPQLLLVLALTGCTTTSITNLTAEHQTKNPSGFYPVEAAFKSQQQTIIWETMKPKVVVGTQFYPMQPTKLMTNRWETLIPVPPGSDSVYYHFKFDYDYATFGRPKPDSKSSPTYRLKLAP